MIDNTTTIIISNSALEMIEVDQNFGRNLANAIRANYKTGKQVEVSALTHLAAATVVEQHDQDDTVVITVGAKYGNVFSSTVSHLVHHTDEAKESILRDIAYKMGFFLRRRIDK